MGAGATSEPVGTVACRAKRQRGLSVPHVSNLEQIQELYGAFGRGDIEPVLAALAPDVEWVEGDIEGLPYRGVHRGPEAVGRDVFAQIPGAYESFELVPQEWVNGGDTIVMLGRVTVRLDGRESTKAWPRSGSSRTARSRASSLSRTRWPRRASWARSADSTPASGLSRNGRLSSRRSYVHRSGAQSSKAPTIASRAKRKPGSGPGHRDTGVTRLCRIGGPGTNHRTLTSDRRG
jgi:uncharacterized protein